MQEEKIIVQTEEEYKLVDIEENELEVAQKEAVKYIEVNSPKSIVVGVSETFGSNGISGSITQHSQLGGRDAKKQHPISAIDRLEDILNALSSGEHFSPYGGYAEFRQWKLPSKGEVARFVSLVYQDEKDLITGGNTFIEVCGSGSVDVYGVTVGESAFCGYQSKNYHIVGGSENHDSSDFARVCLLGVVGVRQGAGYQGAKVGDYVVPDNEGCAVLSENGVGFRVVGVGQRSGATDPYWNFAYVDIALVPQNDNVARVMAELEGTRDDLGGLSIQIGKLENDIKNSITSVIPGINNTLNGMNGAISDAQKQLSDAKDALTTAQETSIAAKQAIEQVTEDYKQATKDAAEAKETAKDALKDIVQIENNMTVLKQHEDKIVGFFDEANENEASLATLVKQTGDITLIKQKIDENGAAIQHLVAHADKYSVGKHSPTYGLTYEQALGILGQTGAQEEMGYFYVPTEEHTETTTIYDWLESESKVITFKVGKVYVWKRDPNAAYDTEHRWQTSDLIKVTHSNSVPTTPAYGDLWYTWNGIVDENGAWIYEPQTLYRWTAYNETEGAWIAVARANDGNARAMSFINQTADKISSTVINLQGDISNISQRVDEISLKVEDSDSGALSQINQTAQQIMMGVYDSSGDASTLELLLEGMQSTANHSEHVCVGEFGGSPASVIKTYSAKPMWTKDGFSFAEANETTETIYPMYYFDSDKRTYYCEQVDDDTYKIYTIGNRVMASINTRVNDNESAITRLTQFETETGTRLTAVEEKSDANSAQISSIAKMNDVFCSEIKSELTVEEIAVFDGATKYSDPPVWDVNEGKFKFVGQPSDNGTYCILDDVTEYYKIIDGSGYERYEAILSSVKYAVIEQKVNQNGTSIGMIVKDGEVQGSIIASAINDRSEVAINADKITLNGTTTFADTLNPDKTAISGDYIRTGIITSNNYTGPITYRKYGVKFGTDEEGNNIIVAGKLSDCIYYTPIVAGDISISKYYYADDIKINAMLYTSDPNHDYVISEEDFDLQPSNINTLGTKFDLNVGTIYSKNFFLDREGNLTITGKITATSGYIGNSAEGIGFTIDKSAVENDDGTITNYYYLANGQVSLRGEQDQQGKNGVYLSPLGLGLGNGNFYVDSEGNVTMKGNIVLDGSITWGTSNSPVLVLYAKTNLSKPTKEVYNNVIKIESEGNPDYNSWHTECQSTDYYASYSYNGGSTWTTPIKIQGKDGANGQNGLDAFVPPHITKTVIDEGKVVSPLIMGNSISVCTGSQDLYNNFDFGELSGFNIYGEPNTTDGPLKYFSITYSERSFGGFPGIYMSSKASCLWDINTEFASGCILDFTYATVKGLGVVPMFE